MLKKILKILSSRLLYVFLGLFLALGIFVVQAAWNTRMQPNTPLTSQAWNDIVQYLEDLDRRIGVVESAGVVTSNGSGTGSAPCNWTGERGVYGNMGGCNDDFYITCDGTKITNTRWGC